MYCSLKVVKFFEQGHVSAPVSRTGNHVRLAPQVLEHRSAIGNRRADRNIAAWEWIRKGARVVPVSLRSSSGRAVGCRPTGFERIAGLD